MRLPRFRIRPLLIGIAFLALLPSLIMQTVQLQRAAAREQQLRAEAEIQRAIAEAENQQVQSLLDQVRVLAGKRLPVEDAPGPPEWR